MELPQELRDALENYKRDSGLVLQGFATELDESATPETIYHYTDDAGLCGILQSGHLWLTDIFDLNDPSEVRHGFAQAAKIIAEWAADKPIDTQKFAGFFQRFHDEGAIEQSAHYFVFCFSKNGDELGQWRAYADNGRGYALGFDTKTLEKSFIKPIPMPASDPITPSTFQITYDDAALLKLQSDMAKHMFALVVPERFSRMHPVVKNQYWMELSVLHAVNAVSGVLFFKHRAYKNEEEYRFPQLFSAAKTVPDLKYKRRPYSLVRYREFDWRREASRALTKIVVGPAADRVHNTLFARDCLEAYMPGSEVEIAYSNIPYRSR